MEKRTYGAPRLVDWVAQIKSGGATVRVHFSGGALTAYGVTPAEYSTASPFIQKVIEQSSYFKEGRIQLLRKTEIPDVITPEKAPKATIQRRTVHTTEPIADASAPVVAKESQEIGIEVQETASAAEETGVQTFDGKLKNVEVSCLQDAQAYLQENFNISSYKVRSYEAAQRAAAEHGILFVGAKFDSISAGSTVEAEIPEGSA